MTNFFINENDKSNSIITPQLNHPNQLTDNLAPDVSTQMNTNFMEQRVVDSQVAYPSTKIQLSQAVENEMADGTWFAKQQLMKPVQLGQYNWSVTQDRATNLADLSFPAVLETVDSLLLRTLRMYAFYKLAPCFRIQINSTQFHQGQLIIAFDPFSFTKINASNDVYNLSYATGLPHVRIMASESDAVELKIPFIHPRSFLTTNSVNFNNLGNLYITVLNPLVVAEGTTPNVTVTLWVYALDAEVHVPIQDHTPVLEPTSGKLPKVKSMNQNQKQAAPEPTQPSLGQNLGNLWDGGSRLFGNILTGNFGQALRSGQGLIDTLGSIFGFDYPCDPVSPIKTIMPIENLAVGIGKSRAQRLAIDPYSMHCLEDDIASESLSAMNLKEILQIPMLMTQFTFSSTSPSESVLFNIPVHPQISPVYVQGTQGDGGIQRTYLSYVSNGFVYWNGGIKYDIEVIATRFHSGKLLFAYIPNTQSIPTYAEAATSLPNVIVDIQQTSNTTFMVPYTSSTAMKSTILKLEGSENDFVDAAIGTLVCYVQNILTNASNVAPSIEVNVYQYGAEDFGLYVPRRPALFIAEPPAVEPTAGISIIEDTNMGHQTTSVLSKDQSHSIPRKHFGEQYSLIDIIRRYSYYLNNSFIFPVGQKTSYLEFPINPFLGYELATENFISYLTYWSGLYSAWSGSIRYKIVTSAPRTSPFSLAVSHHPDPVHLDFIDSNNLEQPGFLPEYANIGYGVCRTNLSQDNAIEIDVPYYSKYNMLLTRQIAVNGSPEVEYSENGNLFVTSSTSQTLTAADAVNFDMYLAVGEDFRFIYLRPPPTDSSIGLYWSTLL